MARVESLYFGNADGDLVKALILSLVGLVFGCIVYVVLVRPSARRDQFQSFGAASRRAGLIAGGVVFGGVALLAFWSSMSGFYSARISDDEIELNYVFPPRTVTLQRYEIEQFGYRAEPQKAGIRYSVLVHTTDGDRYESALGKGERVQPALEHLRRWRDGDAE